MVATTTLKQELERQIIENIHHEPLLDLEKAQAIKRLIEIKGWNSMRAALTLGMDRKYLMTLLSLVDAPKEVKDFIEEKLLSSIAEETGINSI